MTDPRELSSLVVVGIILLSLTVGMAGVAGIAAAQDDGPDEPANFYGDAVSEDGTLAPAGTEIVAVVDGEVRGSTTVEEPGVYAEAGAFEDQLSLDSGAGEEVHFHVGGPDGAEAIESPQPLEAGTFEQLLTFPAGTFEDGPTVEEVVLSVEDDEIQTGQDTTATVVAALDDGTDRTVTHDVVESTDPGVASVDGLTITGESAGTTTLEATYAGQADTVELTVAESAPSFDVTITDVNESVDEGEEVTVDYEIENTGAEAGTQDIVFSVNGSEQARDEGVALDPDATTSGTFTYETDGDDPPEIDVEVASDDDSDTATVAVNAQAFFDVEIQDATSPVTAGQTVEVEVGVENTGDLEATQDVSLSVDGVGDNIDTQEVTLAGGETDSVTLTWRTQAGDAGDVGLTVASADDTAMDTVTVEESGDDFYVVDLTDVSTPVVEGEEVTVDYEIENTGGASGTQDIVFEVDGQEIDRNEDVQLDSGTRTDGTFTYETSDGDAPDIDVKVSSGNDSAAETVVVNEPAFFDVGIEEFNESVVEGDTVEVNATVSNTGDVEATQTIELNVDADQSGTFDTSADTAEVTLAGEETESLTLTYTTETGDADAIDFEVVSDQDREQRTVTVSEPDPAFFDVEITEFDDEVAAGDTVTVDYAVENTGDEQGTQSVEFTVDGETQATDADVTIGGDETATGTFTYETDSDDPPEITTEVSTDDDTATETVAVNTPAEFQINEVDPTPDAAVVGQRITFDVSVENLGDLTATRDITLIRDGESVQTDLDLVGLRGGETDTVQLSYVPVQNDLNGQSERDVTFEVDVQDDTEQVTIPIEEAAAEFEITETTLTPDDEAASGDEIVATATIENTGTGTAEQSVSLVRESSSPTVNPTEVDSTNVELAPDETTEITLTDIPSVDREGETLTYTVDTAADNAESGSIELLESSVFTVEILDYADPVTAGDAVEATARITNDGDITGSETVRLTLDGTVIDEQTVELGGSEDTTLTLSGQTVVDDAGDRELRVRTSDESATQDVTINAPATYQIDDVTATDPVAGTDDLEVTATVTNIGDEPGTQDVQLDGGGLGSDTATDVSLDSDETDTVTLSVAPSESDVGDQLLLVSTDDDAALARSTVLEPAEIDVTIESVTNPVRADQDELEVVAALENTGGVAGTVDAGLELDGEAEATESSVTVDAGETETVTFDGITLDTSQVGELTVGVTAADALDEETVTVLETPEDALFRVSELDIADPTATNDLLRESDATVEISANVENIGDLTDTQDVALVVAGETRDTASVELDGGGDETVTFDLDPTTLTLGDRTITVESDESTQTATRTVRDPVPATFTAEVDEDKLTRGETATATFENTGDQTDEQTVSLDLLVNGDVIASKESTETLASGDSTSLTVTVPDATRAGTYDSTLVASSDDQTTSDPVTVDFGEINDGIAAASAGDTVNVAPGTYDGGIDVEKDVTLASDEAVIDGTGTGTGVTVTGDGAEVTGFTFRGLERAVHVTADNTEIRNSDFRSSVTNGTVIEADNIIITNNQFDANEIALRLADGADGAEIQDNNILGSEDRAVFSTAGIHNINNNNIERSNVAIDADAGKINATNNWWGRPGGPTNDEIQSPVTVEPWQTAPAEEPDYQIIDNNLDDIDAIVEDDPAKVTYTIQNKGGTAGVTADQLVLQLDGTPLDQTEEFEIGENGELAAGETYDGTEFSSLLTGVDETTANALNNGDLELATSDDSSVASNVPVQTAPEFEASIQDAPSSIDADETLEVDADISNVGEAQGSVTAELRLDGESADTTTQSINGGGTDSVTLTRSLTDDDIGTDLLIEVDVGDDTATRTITVNEADDGDENNNNEDDDDPPSSSSGGGGGGGSSGDTGPPSVEEVRDLVSAIESTETESAIEDADPDTPGVTVRPEGTESVREVTFDNEDVVGSLSVTEYNDPPESVSEGISESLEASQATDTQDDTEGDAEDGATDDSSGTAPSISVVSVSDITPDNTAAAESPATVQFSVSSEMVNNPDQLTVFKETSSSEFSDNTWTELETTVEEVNDQEVTVSARAESFSLFAVAEVERGEGATQRDDGTAQDNESEQDDEPTEDDGSTQDDESEQEDDGSSSPILIIGFLVVIAIAGAALYVRNSG